MVCADLQKTSRSLQTLVVESDLAGHMGHQALLNAVTQGGTIPEAKFVQTNCISSSCPAPSCNSQPPFFFHLPASPGGEGNGTVAKTGSIHECNHDDLRASKCWER